MPFADAVHEFLTVPTLQARLSHEEAAVQFGTPSPIEHPRIAPVVLDPLSKEDREQLALFFEVKDAAEFWVSVEAGDFLEMALRPHDLKWLVGYWNDMILPPYPKLGC